MDNPEARDLDRFLSLAVVDKEAIADGRTQKYGHGKFEQYLEAIRSLGD
ncbi:MAG: hypothetical protein KIT39_12630 [Nitrospirales bacterium]|nr:hypothetical protein [Nitrospirales bacterium]